MTTLIRMIYCIIQEIFAIGFAVVFYLFDQTKFDPEKPLKSKKKPILLVHGYLHNSSSWWLMRSRLLNEGFGPVYTINLGSPFKSIKDYASDLEIKVAQILKDTGSEKVILIGHSMGGLVSACFGVKITGKVEAIITMASPMEGSILANISFGASGREMIPGSPFLQDLQKRLKAASQLRFIHIGSSFDELVIPNKSTVPNFTPNSKRIWLPYIGHVAHLISCRTFKEILHALSSMDAK